VRGSSTTEREGRSAATSLGRPQQAFKAYGEIKPGVMRKDVETNFDYDGGLNWREHGRYTYRGCNLIKLEVDFVLASDAGNPPHSNDTVKTVSKLFIDDPTKD
jgi:hypothetical protein